MIHTIEELEEYADEHHGGKFYLWKDEENASEPGKPWGFQFGTSNDGRHTGETAEKVVKKALSADDLARNPDRRV